MTTKKQQNRVTIDDLAIMVKGGFDAVTQEMRSGFEQNEKDHEEIKLRLDNVAYRFELVELQKRVEVLEHRIDMKRR